MKKLIYILILVPVVFTSCSSAVYTTASKPGQYQANALTRVTVGYETFYNELTPYGRWIDYPGQGYMWIPAAETGFRPYATNGHWAYTNNGWTWVSNYNWGWAPFHYGRWMYEDGYGWMWLPGHEWAPAWVTWGQSGGYYGWAPLAPGISINVSISGGWMPPQHYWNFVPAEHITRENVNTYVINNTTNINVVNNITKNITIINNNNTFINNTTVSNNNTRNNTTVYNRGPMVKDVEKLTNHKVQPVLLREDTKPGASVVSNNELSVYRPFVKQYNEKEGTAKAAPARVEVYKSVNNNNPNNGRALQDLHPVVKPPVTQQKQVLNNQQQPLPTELKELPRTAAPVQQQKPVQQSRNTPATEQKRVPDLPVNNPAPLKGKPVASTNGNIPGQPLTPKEQRQQKKQQKKEDTKQIPPPQPKEGK